MFEELRSQLRISSVILVVGVFVSIASQYFFLTRGFDAGFLIGISALVLGISISLYFGDKHEREDQQSLERMSKTREAIILSIVLVFSLVIWLWSSFITKALPNGWDTPFYLNAVHQYASQRILFPKNVLYGPGSGFIETPPLIIITTLLLTGFSDANSLLVLAIETWALYFGVIIVTYLLAKRISNFYAGIAAATILATSLAMYMLTWSIYDNLTSTLLITFALYYTYRFKDRLSNSSFFRSKEFWFLTLVFILSLLSDESQIVILTTLVIIGGLIFLGKQVIWRSSYGEPFGLLFRFTLSAFLALLICVPYLILTYSAGLSSAINSTVQGTASVTYLSSNTIFYWLSFFAVCFATVGLLVAYRKTKPFAVVLSVYMISFIFLILLPTSYQERFLWMISIPASVLGGIGFLQTIRTIHRFDTKLEKVLKISLVLYVVLFSTYYIQTVSASPNGPGFPSNTVDDVAIGTFQHLNNLIPASSIPNVFIASGPYVYWVSYATGTKTYRYDPSIGDNLSILAENITQDRDTSARLANLATSFANWVPIGGNWQDNGTDYSQLNSSLTWWSSMSYLPYNVSNGTMSIDFKINGGTEDAIWLMWDFNPKNMTGSIIQIRPQNNYAGYIANGSVNALNANNLSFQTNSWHKIMLVLNNGSAAAFLDGKLLLTEANNYSSGYLGLSTIHTQAEFANFSATSLPSPIAHVSVVVAWWQGDLKSEIVAIDSSPIYSNDEFSLYYVNLYYVDGIAFLST